MKIFTSSQIKAGDEYTIAHEPISSIDLMERAAQKLCEKLLELFSDYEVFDIYCGPGNNGGDGLAMARMLATKGKNISVFTYHHANRISIDCETNIQRLPSSVECLELKGKSDFKNSSAGTIIIDALLGTGATRLPEGLLADIIHHINAQPVIKIAIDIPSGLKAEENDITTHHPPVINADYTLTIQQPKLSFFMPENSRFVGQCIIVEIGISQDYIEQTHTPYHLIEKSIVKELIPERNRFGHKGTYGHALIVGGSYGKIGAVSMASKACIRSGAGLVSVYIPKCGYQILQISNPEIMVITGNEENEIEGRVPDVLKYRSIGIGPGMGTGKNACSTFKHIIHEYNAPLVIDADAINILSENKTWLEFIQPGSVLTPHPGEFDRLAGKSESGWNRCVQQIELSKRYGIYIILKGAYTSISTPTGNLYFNSTGNPGMATGGSGDVLTGIITGLMAQGLTPLSSAIAGVYLHGLAGDFALQKQSHESLIATDIIEHLGIAFKDTLN